MSWIGRFLGARAGRNFNSEAQSLVAETVLLGNDIAQWRADSELLHAIQETVLPTALALGAILIANPLVTLLGGGAEAHHIVVGSLALAAFLWAGAVSLAGLVWLLGHVRMMLITRLWPRRYLRLVIAMAARDWMRDQAASIPGGTWRAFLHSFQRETGSQTEMLAARLADQIGATLWRHVALRLGYVLAPMMVALTYYRLVIYPSFLGASTWLSMLYPIAALVDAVAGTALRDALMAGPAGGPPP